MRGGTVEKNCEKEKEIGREGRKEGRMCERRWGIIYKE